MLLLLLESGSVCAQSSIGTFLQPRSIPNSETLVKLILLDNVTPAVVTSYGESLLLHPFDESSTAEDQTPLLVYSNTNRKLSAYKVIGDDVFILSKPKDDEKQNVALKEYSISLTSLALDSVEHVKDVHFNLSKSGSDRNQNPLFFRPSNQGTYMLVCQQDAFRKDSKAVVNIFILGSDTTIAYHLPTAFDSDDLQLMGASIDERGMVYFAAKSGVKLNSPFQKKHLVYSFDPFNKILTEFDLSSSEFFIQDMIVTTLDSGFTISTLYSIDPLVDGMSNGYSYIASSSDGKEITKRLGGSFSSDIRAAHWGDDSKDDGYISDLFLERTISLDGLQYVVMERRYHDQICNADPSTGIMTCTDQYHYNGVTFENPLNPNKSATVPKRQLDYDKPSIFTSHSIFTRNNAVWMVYNDHFKNESLSSEKIMNNPSRSVVKFTVISPSGEITYGTFSEDRQNNFVFTPKPGIAHNDEHLFYLQKDGDHHRIGKISFSALSKGVKGNK